MAPGNAILLKHADFVPPKQLGDEGACAIAVSAGIVDPNIWVPEDDAVASVREAAAWCRTCQVQPRCLEYAQNSPGIQGVYGGYAFGLRVGRRAPSVLSITSGGRVISP